MPDDFFSSVVRRAQLRQPVPGAIQPRLVSRFEPPAVDTPAIDWSPTAYDTVGDAAIDTAFRAPERRSVALADRPLADQPLMPSMPAADPATAPRSSAEQPVVAIVQAAPAEPALPRPASPAPRLIARSELPVAAVPAIDDQPTAGDRARDVAIDAGTVAPERRAASLAERSPAAAHPATAPRPSAEQPPATAVYPAPAQPVLLSAPALAPPDEEQSPTLVSAQPGRQEQGEILRGMIIERIAEREQPTSISQIIESGADQRMAPAPAPAPPTAPRRAAAEREQPTIVPRLVETGADQRMAPAPAPASPTVPQREQAIEPISAATQPIGSVAQWETNTGRLSHAEPVAQKEAMRPLIRPAIRKLEDRPPDRRDAIERANGAGKPDHAVESPAPTVHVTIGRIEVRATPAPPAPAPKPRSTSVMTLEEYLQRRATGGQS